MSGTTLSASIPAANVVGILDRLRLPSKDFMRQETGIMIVDHHLEERDLMRLVRLLVQEQSRSPGNGKVSKLVDALVLDLTTSNVLNEQERDVIWTMIRHGGNIPLKEGTTMQQHHATPGTRKALSRVKWRGQCTHCGFLLPKYPGRYPSRCPSCKEVNLSIDTSTQWVSPDISEAVDGLLGFVETLIEAEHRGFSGYTLAESKVSDRVREFFHALSSKSAKALSDKALKVFAGKAPGCGVNLLQETVQEVARAPYFLDRSHIAVWSPLIESVGPNKDERRQVYQRLVDNLTENVTPARARVLRTAFELFEPSPGIVSRLRSEVSKRPALVESIRSFRKNRDRLNLVKALSSCLTRTMIEGQTSSEDYGYMEIGKTVFAMMERAFAGDTDTPQRFLEVFFLG